MRDSVRYHLALSFLKMFLRDRQSLFFGLLFPLIFMSVLGSMNTVDRGPIDIGVADHSNNRLSQTFVELLAGNSMFSVRRGSEETLRDDLLAGDVTLLLIIPADLIKTTVATELTVVVDATQVRQLGLIIPALEKALITVERQLRDNDALFSLKLEDVKARSQRYIDFLLPGILAFTLMQIAIAGSGFNVTEYRRKGILKRLFVTPIRPSDFIISICAARLLLCLMQLSILLLVAVTLLGVTISANYALMLLVIVLGTIVFLCLGFCIGSLAKTQQAVGAIGTIFIFPQVVLSGVFYPIDIMPEFIQPIARLLPLSNVVNCLRSVMNDRAGLIDITYDLAGVAAWMLISFLLATRFFVWKEVVKE